MSDRIDTRWTDMGRASRAVPALPPHLEERATLVGDRTEPVASGRYVLYWTHHAQRAEQNPAFDVARHFAAGLGVPLLIYAGLGGNHPYNNDRQHTFILEGLRDVAGQYRAVGHALRVHVPTDPSERSPLRALAADASLVVTEDFPAPPFPRWTESLAARTAAAVIAVDTACIVPMRAIETAHDRAFKFRKAAERMFKDALGLRYPDDTPQAECFEGELGFLEVDLAERDIADIVAACRIDHTIPAVEHTVGGSAAGYARWEAFKADRLGHYHERRNDASDLDGVSRMSPYLHQGAVSALRLAQEAHATRTSGAEKFLDELFVWRELAHNLAVHRHRALHSLDVLPRWARDTLVAHSDDRREVLYTHEALRRAATQDRLWNLAQRSLLQQGELHNNIRMTWAKMLPLWTESPAAALEELIDHNHRLSLDGCDPNSYGGLLWALGLFDRAFPPAQPVLGTVRPRDTRTHARRLDVTGYERVVTRRRTTLRVGVIGAGIAGLAAARAMQDQGHEVVVLEKARGPGGRTATRHADPYRFDHGAQYFTVRDPRTRMLLDSWLDLGVVARYSPRIAEIDADGVREKSGEGTTRYVGVPGMNGLAKHLARDVEVRPGSRVERCVWDGRSWHISGDEIDERFDALVCTAPPAQAAALLEGVETPLHDELSRAELAPCWAVMLGFDRAIDFEFDAAFVNDGPLSWIARHHPAKAGRPAIEAWTLHASADWSREHLERDAGEVCTILTETFAAITGAPAPAHATAHRWRFALPTSEPFENECLWDHDRRLALAGDWVVGGRVEGAYLSGCAAAGRVMALAASREHRAAMAT